MENNYEYEFRNDTVLGRVNKPSVSKINWINAVYAVGGAILAILNLWELIDEATIEKINASFVLLTPVIPIITVYLRTFQTIEPVDE